jgi:DNA polymerase-1
LPACRSSRASTNRHHHGAAGRWLALIDTAELTSVDTETTSLDPMTAQMVGISLSVEAGKGAYIPLAHRYRRARAAEPREVLERMKPWLEDPAKPKLGQNLKYDSHIFENHGVTLRGIVHDTLLQSYVFESHKPHDMDTMAMRHLGYTTIPFVDVCGKGVNQICFDQVELARATEYAAEDSDITLRLHQTMIGHVEGDKPAWTTSTARSSCRPPSCCRRSSATAC